MSTLEPVAMPEKISPDMEKTTAKPRRKKKSLAGDAARSISSPWASVAAIVIAVLWTIPTIGLLVTSFRDQRAINRSGWWTAFGDPGAFTLENYRQALAPGSSAGLGQYFINTIVITIPAVALPLFLASLAAYAFAWMPFPGRDALFVAVFALQIVPLQVALIPLLDIYVNKLGFGASYWSVWLSHTIFALPLAIFLIHNFMRELPAELMEAARVDGAGHVTIFFKILLPSDRLALGCKAYSIMGLGQGPVRSGPQSEESRHSNRIRSLPVARRQTRREQLDWWTVFAGPRWRR